MKQIKLWFRTWKTLFMWIWMVRQMMKVMPPMSDPEGRAACIQELDGFKEHIGNCVLTLAGVFPLEDWGPDSWL